eukprot:COSAG02_NODE_3090_length_7388_cov_7.725614_5_plen_79_part_00
MVLSGCNGTSIHPNDVRMQRSNTYKYMATSETWRMASIVVDVNVYKALVDLGLVPAPRGGTKDSGYKHWPSFDGAIFR